MLALQNESLLKAFTKDLGDAKKETLAQFRYNLQTLTVVELPKSDQRCKPLYDFPDDAQFKKALNDQDLKTQIAAQQEEFMKMVKKAKAE